MVWLSDGENYLFVSSEYTNVTDGQTDRQTPHDGIGCAMHSIARQKVMYGMSNIIRSLSRGNIRYELVLASRTRLVGLYECAIRVNSLS